MPVYTYSCNSCNGQFDVSMSFKDSIQSVIFCPHCGSNKTFKRFHSPLVIFKGEGFYTNDSKK